jgi:hypothetical protein
MDIRKIIIIFVVAVLFSVFVFAVIEAVYPTPKYEDFCRGSQPYATKPYYNEPKNCTSVPVSEKEENQCVIEEHGRIDFKLNSLGCPVSYYCETCDYKLQQAYERHSIYVFYISAFLALLAIFVGLYLPAKANTLNEWIGTGFMLGGTFALFFGTLQSFQALDRIVRPIVIFLELALVIFLAYKKVGNLREDKKKKR